MELATVLKIIFVFVFFAEAFIAGIIPSKNRRFRTSPMILGIANAFSGGVFLAIAFMHIMPEEIEDYNDLMKEKGIENPFPLPYLLVFVGYTFILIIDKVLFDTHSAFEHNEDPAE